MKNKKRQAKAIVLISFTSALALFILMAIADMRIGKMLDLDPHTYLLYAHADSEQKIGQITIMGRTYKAPYIAAKRALELFERIS